MWLGLGTLAGLLEFGGLLDCLKDLGRHLLESPHLVEVRPLCIGGNPLVRPFKAVVLNRAPR